MASEFDPSGLGGIIGTAVASLITAVVGTSAYFRSKKVNDAESDSTVKGFKGNDTVLENLVKEVTRLTAEVAAMRVEIDELKRDEAEVKVLAIDCYALANECSCQHNNKRRLLDHLLMIIRKRDDKADKVGGA